MANAVYERTKSALTGLLPRRAASSVLDRALWRHRRSPDDVDGEQMARVLLQGVYRELRGLVPDAGLRRTLRRLAREVRGWSGSGRGATPSQVRAGPRPAAPSTAATPIPDPAPPLPDPAPLPDPGPPLPDEGALAPDGLATVLAAIDGVHGVGVYDDAGRPLEVRGALAEPARLGGLVAAGAALLQRGDALRSMAIETNGGRLVAVPVPPQWLALTGTADLNLGAVYAALAAHQEER